MQKQDSPDLAAPPPNKRRRLQKIQNNELNAMEINKIESNDYSCSGLTEDEMIQMAVQASLAESSIHAQQQYEGIKHETGGTIKQCDLCGKDVMCVQTDGLILCTTCRTGLGV